MLVADLVIAGVILYQNSTDGKGFSDILNFPWDQDAIVTKFDGTLTLTRHDNGTHTLQWPKAENAKTYTVEILSEKNKVLHSDTVIGDNQCILPVLPNSEKLTIRLTADPGNVKLETEITLRNPTIKNLKWVTDRKKNQVTLTYELPENTYCTVYRTDTGEQIAESSEGSIVLNFQEDGSMALPKYDTEMGLSFRATYSTDAVIYYGTAAMTIGLRRQDFLDTSLEVQCHQVRENTYDLTWNEVACDYYEVQISENDGENWHTVALIPRDRTRQYITNDLKPFSSYQFRIVAVGGDTTAKTTISTAHQTVFSTIWPLKDLEVYSDFGGKNVVGTAPAGTAYCVLENINGFFGIRYGDGVGYIDSTYCLINLPEYLGDLCAYNITNSYSSAFLVHDYYIDEVSGTVIAGYENIQQHDEQFLVPLLYPVAQKLLVAAKEAQMQGYRLKIYDAFRPHIATSTVYSLAGKILNKRVPAETYTGNIMTDLDLLNCPLETLTYRQLMTDNGRYKLANFLANNISKHNIGIALDLTLESYDGTELKMQTAIHDLSWYSEPARNNETATTLQRIMVGAGFGTLKSEWWHFQDNVALNSLELVHLENGVSAQCWMKDNHGWRYRQADGTYLASCVQEIDGVSYTFDADGYATAQ